MKQYILVRIQSTLTPSFKKLIIYLLERLLNFHELFGLQFIERNGLGLVSGVSGHLKTG